MTSLIERLKKAGAVKYSETLAESKFFIEKDMIPTEVPIINIALSGRLDGGLTPGLTILAGPSKHYKSLLGLFMAKAYMTKYEDSVCLFYDSEFGITPEFIKAYDIDPNRIIHIPIEHIEQLKFDISKRLEEIKRGDHVFVFIDSIGNLASKKEIEDALEEKTVADMTRAKALKSLFRIITPQFTTKDIPCVVINHTYQEMGMFPKQIMSGGTGALYSANQIFFISKSQEKEGSELSGWTFTINIEKSRYVREKAKFPFTVTFEGGLNKWSGLLEIAMELGFVRKPSQGWYSRVNTETGEVENARFREKDTNTAEFWKPILSNKQFHEAIKNKFMLGTTKLLSETKLEEDVSKIVTGKLNKEDE